MRFNLFLFSLGAALWICGSTWVNGKEFYETVPAGKKERVWARMCQSTYCWFGVCVNLESASTPATAVITLKAAWRSAETINVGMGRYCAPQRSFTYFMTYEMQVEATAQGIRITIYESDDYRP